MCGIAGSVEWKPGAKSFGFNLSAMRNRGPDAQIQMDSSSIAIKVRDGFRFRLGHARLSILDLTNSANQPMSSPDGRWWIVFNGEIYNHLELRAELESKGVQFQTSHSDTETLLRGYIFWGKGVLNRINGMFAFVVVDAVNGVIFGARDRMGIKPFFYRIGDGVFEFASELRALNAPKDINLQAIRQYFHFLQVPGEMTFFEKIFKLEAADCFQWNGIGEPKIESWWRPLKDDVSRNKSSDELEFLLLDSVRLRLQADVPVGAYLSGGLDSSLLAAMASKFQPISTFSFGFDTKQTSYKSELPMARMVARHINSSHHEVQVGKREFIDAVRQSFKILDEPISDTACAPILLLSQAAKSKGVKVCLGGEGADELFLGYRVWWDSFYVYKFWSSLPKPFRPLAASTFNLLFHTRKPDWNSWFKRLEAGRFPMWGGIDVMVRHDEAEYLHPELIANTVDPYKFVRERMEDEVPIDSDYFQRLSNFDLRFRLPEQLLARIDRMSMAASVEARVPFLDHRVVEYAMKLPLGQLGTRQHQKLNLKRIAESYLPDEIVGRPKDGFSIPLEDVLSEQEISWCLFEQHDIPFVRNSNEFMVKLNPREKWAFYSLGLWLQELKQ